MNMIAKDNFTIENIILMKHLKSIFKLPIQKHITLIIINIDKLVEYLHNFQSLCKHNY